MKRLQKIVEAWEQGHATGQEPRPGKCECAEDETFAERHSPYGPWGGAIPSLRCGSLYKRQDELLDRVWRDGYVAVRS